MVPRCLWNLSKPWFVNFGDDAHQAVSVPILPLPPAGSLLDNSALLDRFLAYVADQKLELYPAQEEAILELYDGNNLILTTPTGSGKSLVAAALHYQSLAQGRRSVYTCPIKALVNEKWLALCRLFGPEKVGLSTGDASVNLGAPILCCTAEILANLALREGSGAQVDDVIMDEFHYYADADRGVAWQIPLLTLSKARFLLISATKELSRRWFWCTVDFRRTRFRLGRWLIRIDTSHTTAKLTPCRETETGCERESRCWRAS